MISVYSPFGCSPDIFKVETEKKIKIIIDPIKDYFTHQIFFDRNNYDKLILIHGFEPKEQNDIVIEIISKKSFFDGILSSSPEVINNCENCIKFIYGSSWVLTDQNKKSIKFKKDYYNIFTTDKKFQLSFIMSRKNFLTGHKLRHRSKHIISQKRNFELMFPPRIDEKYKLFEESMFHITIENTKNINYITEKIIDCFMSFTVPIYWGCPNIGDYFNTDGIITFESEEQLQTILDNLTVEDYYSRIDSIVENYTTSFEHYAFLADRLNYYLNKFVNT